MVYKKNILKNIISYFTFNLDIFKLSRIEQEAYLNKFKSPKNDLARSFYQYRCQKYLVGKPLKFMILNIIFCITLPPIIIYYLCRKNQLKSDSDAVFTYPEIGKDIIPNELIAEFPNIIDTSFKQKKELKLRDLIYIFKIIVYKPFSFYFLAKLITKIAVYRSLISQYNPKALIVTSEYSFTSSILTEFCMLNNIQHINIMHGEKLFFIRDSFFRFDRFYVYDNHYIELFGKLRAGKNIFFISKPKSLFIPNNKKLYDYKYYLANFTELEIKKISNIINILSSREKSIIVRPHPRYGNKKLLKKYINIDLLEDPKTTTIKDSLSTAKNVIGLYSTVLLQAYLNNITCYLDDYTYEEEISKLNDLDYILCKKKVHYISKMING